MAALGAIVAILAIAGCGQAIPSSQGQPAKVSADESGKYLVDQGGHVLYLFAADEKNASYCSGACASVWPPYETSAQPAAGAGVSQKLLGTITDRDGGTQVTYNGAPLYYYAGDAGKPDTENGEGISQFGAAWYQVSAKNGAPFETESQSGGGS